MRCAHLLAPATQREGPKAPPQIVLFPSMSAFPFLCFHACLLPKVQSLLSLTDGTYPAPPTNRLLTPKGQSGGEGPAAGLELEGKKKVGQSRES